MEEVTREIDIPQSSNTPRLLVRSGSLRGKKCPVSFSPFTIGSDQEASLTMSDPLVSRLHAEIVQGEGGTWYVHDLGSRNGTKVNDVLLSKDAKVPLKAGDRIFIAHYSMVFDDGAPLSGDRRLWIGLGLVALAVMAGAVLFRLAVPPAATWMTRARQHVGSAAFEEAENCLDRAMSARGAGAHQGEADTLRAQLATWKSTMSTWQRAREALASAEWDDAARLLGELETGDEKAWGWNEDGRSLRREALRAAALLGGFRAAGDSSGLDGSHANLRALLAGMAASVPPYLNELVSQAERLLSELEEFGFLAKLTSWPPAVEEVQRLLKRTRDGSSGSLARRAEAMLEQVNTVAADMALYRKAESMLTQMRFSELRALKPAVPETGAGIDQRLVLANGLIRGRLKLLMEAAKVAEAAVTARAGAQAQALTVHEWRKSGALDGVLNCDTLASDPPSPERKQPSGSYDRFVGVGDFRSFCMELAGLRQLRPVKTPFKTVVVSAVEVAAAARALVEFFDEHSGTGWTKGALGKTVTECRQSLDRQTALAGELMKEVEKGEGRRALIAAGLILKLAQPGAVPDEGRTKLRDWIAAEFKKNQEQLCALAKDHDGAAEARRPEIKRQILSVGLPSDPVVVKFWDSAEGLALLQRALGATVDAPPRNGLAVTPPGQEPVDPTKSEVYVARKSAVLKSIRSAATLKEVSDSTAAVAAWEADPKMGPVQADVQSMVTEVKAKYASLADTRYKSALDFYKAEKITEGDKVFRQLLDVVRAAPARYGRSDLLAYVSRLKTARAKMAKKPDTVAEKEPIDPPPKEDPPEEAPPKKDPIEKAPPSGEMGVLEIVVNPAAALVYVNDKLLKKKSLSLDPSVNHAVRIECPGYKTHRQYYRVRAGKTRTVEILLQKEKKRSGFFR